MLKTALIVLSLSGSLALPGGRWDIIGYRLIQSMSIASATSCNQSGVENSKIGGNKLATLICVGGGQGGSPSKDSQETDASQRGGETHENCPRNALRASRRNARVAVSVVGHEEWVVDDVSCRGHHEVRPVVPGRGQADEGPDTGRGGVRDRLVPGQRPASADQRGAEPAGGWTLGHDAATQAAGDQVLL